MKSGTGAIFRRGRYGRQAVTFLAGAGLSLLSACNHSPDTTAAVPVKTDSELVNGIITDFPKVLARPCYAEMAKQTALLQIAAHSFDSLLNTTDSLQAQVHLYAARSAWRNARLQYEQAEAFLFGPVATEGIDPDIDTWPVNRLDLDKLLQSGANFSPAFLSTQQEALRGFHPLEYMLWGAYGQKLTTDFTLPERAYMLALAGYLNQKAQQLNNQWAESTNANYGLSFQNAGPADSVYSTRYAAVKELVTALAGMCEELGSDDGKIGKPLLEQNSGLEESPFARNSLTDFGSNLQGIQNVYTGTYNYKTGTSLSDFTGKYNRILDQQIKAQITLCISLLQNIQGSFGSAIYNQKQQLQEARSAINDLKDLFEKDLSNLIDQKIKNL